MLRVGVLGLGVMGSPIARNLIASGFSVAVFNRSPDKAEVFRDSALIAETTHDIIEWSDSLLLTLSGSAAIDACLRCFDENGVASPLNGKIVVNMATVAPDYSQRLESYIESNGGRYVEAPISGSRKPAELGRLLILAATKDETALKSMEPVFDSIGRKTVVCGTPPDAMRMKLANNLLLIALLEGLVEVTHFATGVGLEPRDVFEVILEGPMSNELFRGKMAKLLDLDFQPEAPIKHVAKDLDLICHAAEQVGIAVPGASVDSKLFADAMAGGMGDEDVLAVIKVLSSQARQQ